jgi:hypothetical protein
MKAVRKHPCIQDVLYVGRRCPYRKLHVNIITETVNITIINKDVPIMVMLPLLTMWIYLFI